MISSSAPTQLRGAKPAKEVSNRSFRNAVKRYGAEVFDLSGSHPIREAGTYISPGNHALLIGPTMVNGNGLVDMKVLSTQNTEVLRISPNFGLTPAEVVKTARRFGIPFHPFE